MIQSRIVKGLTEIYVEDEGIFITESFPTNFHTFCTSKILNSKDNINNYKEVTLSERELLEALDSLWIEPPEEFIKRWDNKCAVTLGLGNVNKYNRLTGFFLLNGLLDITYDQAIIIDQSPDLVSNVLNMLLYHRAMRTNFHLTVGKGISPSFNRTFQGNRTVEVAVAHGELQTEVFDDCVNLHTVWIRFIRSQLSLFTGCKNLENIFFTNSYEKYSLTNHAWFHLCPKLTFQSLKECVIRNTGTTPIIYYVHLDVYDKITDESNEDWNSLLFLAEEHNITFSTI